MQAKYEGVWMLSEGVRMVSGRCMRWKQFETDWKQLYKYHGIQILLFLLVASCRPIMGVSGWCLRVSCIVWMVSEHVWQMTGVGRCHINWQQLNKYHGIQILLFLPVAACRPNMERTIVLRVDAIFTVWVSILWIDMCWRSRVSFSTGWLQIGWASDLPLSQAAQASRGPFDRVTRPMPQYLTIPFNTYQYLTIPLNATQYIPARQSHPTWYHSQNNSMLSNIASKSNF